MARGRVMIITFLGLFALVGPFGFRHGPENDYDHFSKIVFYGK